MLPDAGLAAAATHSWWPIAIICVAMVALLLAAGGFGGLLISRASGRQEEPIRALEGEFHNCKLRCAEKTAEYVTRVEHEAERVRMDKKLTRIHERVDAIALKLGLPPQEAVRDD